MLNPFFSPHLGGTEKHILEVGKRLSKKHNITILSASLPDTKRREEMYGMEIIRSPSIVLYDVPSPIPPPVPIAPFQLRDIYSAAKDADIVHIHNRFAYHFGTIILLKKILKKKTALTLHNARPVGINFATDFWGGLYDETIGYSVMRNSDQIAGVSRNTIDITVPSELKGRARPIYNGVDTDFFNTRVKADKLKENISKGEKIVLCVSRFMPQKGINYLIKAFAEVLKEEKKVNLLLVGWGPLEAEYRHLIKQLGIGKNVTIISNMLSQKELRKYYAISDIFVLPSLWEPFGIVLCEAMASGKPVIASHVGGIPEIVTEKTGLLFEKENISELASKILILLQDNRLRKIMGKNGRKRVEDYFTWDNTAQGYDLMYKDLV